MSFSRAISEVKAPLVVSAISSLDQKSFDAKEIELLRNRFDAYIKEMDLKMDESHFPDFVSTAYKDSDSFDTIKSRYEYILLDVWATWCSPCIQQHPTVNALSNKYKDAETFAIVGIAISSPQNLWEEYLSKGDIHYPNYFLDERASQSFLNSLNIKSIPRYALLRTKDSKLIEHSIAFERIEEVLKEHKLLH